jgi:hypothetical protein
MDNHLTLAEGIIQMEKIGLMVIKNCVAFRVRKRTIPTGPPPLLGGVSANFCG